MLEYEKKLHLDTKWNTIQSHHIINKIAYLMVNLIIYVSAFILLKWLTLSISTRPLWHSLSNVFSLYDTTFNTYDILCFFIGLIVYFYGSIRFTGIYTQNHSVRKNSENPSQLLVTGYYEKIRHPMYGTFIIRFAGIMLSLNSFLAVGTTIFFAIFQYANALFEERKTLIPLFGNQYTTYTSKVKRIVLLKRELTVIIVWITATLLGLFF